MRIAGSPMKRTRCCSRSSMPPTGSCTVPSRETESALNVKSRRSASFCQLRPNRTFALRPNVSTSSRNVVTSKPVPSITTVTVPCSTPVGTGRKPAAAARRITSSGSAVVATSISPGGCPSSTFLTAPPTTRASSPSRSSTAKSFAGGPCVSHAVSFSCTAFFIAASHRARISRSPCARARKSSGAARRKTARSG